MKKDPFLNFFGGPSTRTNLFYKKFNRTREYDNPVLRQLNISALTTG